MSHIVLTIISIIIINIIFTITIIFDNLIRLIPSGKRTYDDKPDYDSPKSIPCHIQAIVLTIFDKLMLTLMTSYYIISYFGICRVDLYKIYEKAIFILLTLFSILISIIFAILFYIQGISDRSEYCYVETKNTFKKIVDSIVTGILLLISLLCIGIIMRQIYQTKKEKEMENMTQEIDSFNKHLKRFAFNLVITLFIFIYVILLILKLLTFNSFVKDLIYILLSFLAELFFTINNELVKIIKKILCCCCSFGVKENIEEDYIETLNEENEPE